MMGEFKSSRLRGSVKPRIRIVVDDCLFLNVFVVDYLFLNILVVSR